MLKPLKQFVCDQCGQIIESPEKGWVEWRQNERKAYGFRIVHHATSSPLREEGKNCYDYTGHHGRMDLPLDSFINHIPQLLVFLDVGPYHEPEYRGIKVKDMREFLEFVRRLTVPYYEEARLYWEKAICDDFFYDFNPVYIYTSSSLKEVIEKYGDS
jgi:hypothetical protein